MASSISPLLSLPPELRNRIYEEVSVVTEFELGAHAAPGVLLSCKQIHNEALDLFYAHATFILNERDMLSSWLSKLPNKRRDLIQDIRYAGYMRELPLPRDNLDGVERNATNLIRRQLELFLEAHGIPLRDIAVLTIFGSTGRIKMCGLVGIGYVPTAPWLGGYASGRKHSTRGLSYHKA